MNRGYDQGLGLPNEYNMMFFVCTDFFIFAPLKPSYSQTEITEITKAAAPQRLQEVPSRFELENKGFADLRLTTWLWHRKKMER